MKRIFGYILAFIIGIVLAFFLVFNYLFTDSSGNFSERFITFVIVALAYGIIGFCFGFIGKKASFRWGIVLSMPAFIIALLYALKEKQILLLAILYVITSVIFSSAFAYFASKISKDKTNKQ